MTIGVIRPPRGETTYARGIVTVRPGENTEEAKVQAAAAAASATSAAGSATAAAGSASAAATSATSAATSAASASGSATGAAGSATTASGAATTATTKAGEASASATAAAGSATTASGAAATATTKAGEASADADTAELQALIALSAASAVRKSETFTFTTSLTDGSYQVLSGPYDGNIKRIVAQVLAGVSGTFDLTVLVDGVPVWGPTAIDATGTDVTVTEAFLLGDSIEFVIENSSGVTSGFVQVDYEAAVPPTIPSLSGLLSDSAFTGATADRLFAVAADHSITEINLGDFFFIEGGILKPKTYFLRTQSGGYTLGASTGDQKLFSPTGATNGALNLPVGWYEFFLDLHISGMGSTTGNGQFKLLGTATLANCFGQVIGVDADSPASVANRTGSFMLNSTQATSSSVSGTIGTGMAAQVTGRFGVTATGTVIPSIKLANAVAGLVEVSSSFLVRPLYDDPAALFSAGAS